MNVWKTLCGIGVVCFSGLGFLSTRVAAESTEVTGSTVKWQAPQQDTAEIDVIDRDEPVEFFTRRDEQRPHEYEHVMIARMTRSTKEKPDTNALAGDFALRIARRGEFLWDRELTGPAFGPSDADARFYLSVLRETGGEWENDEALRAFAGAYRDGRIVIQRYVVADGEERANAYNSLVFDPSFDSHHLQLRYYSDAPITEEEARKIMSAFRQLQQLGVYGPIQNHLATRVVAIRDRAEEMPAEIAKLERELAMAEAELKEHPPIEAATLVELRTKRRLLAVDVAGTQAKVDQCKTILEARANDVSISMDAKQSEITRTVESLKITAEIELAGLSAREKAINEMIASGQRRIELRMQIDSELKMKLQAARYALDDYRSEAAHLDKQRELYIPLELMKNEVEIRPVRYVVQN